MVSIIILVVLIIIILIIGIVAIQAIRNPTGFNFFTDVLRLRLGV